VIPEGYKMAEMSNGTCVLVKDESKTRRDTPDMKTADAKAGEGTRGDESKLKEMM
jgi:hypothetical protein